MLAHLPVNPLPHCHIAPEPPTREDTDTSRCPQGPCLCAGVVYLLDACQSVGQMPVDVQSLRCHFLTGTGRKWLRGPRGTGFLYAAPLALADTRLEPSAMDVRGARWLGAAQYAGDASARRYEEYEMSFACKVCLSFSCSRRLCCRTTGAAAQQASHTWQPQPLRARCLLMWHTRPVCCLFASACMHPLHAIVRRHKHRWKGWLIGPAACMQSTCRTFQQAPLVRLLRSE